MKVTKAMDYVYAAGIIIVALPVVIIVGVFNAATEWAARLIWKRTH